ncbi:hypothetical protein DRE_03970 [Drechslerella stenobrocha 248]|uniref:Uncharacterized protein n=1 Tax=Drechslerella stenobrocha 248 TaxID=1043628 RepID=W7IC98_9PEZI|nr:hypothetical protein DRE_03970 [Drechslerella stenobrocha 248]
MRKTKVNHLQDTESHGDGPHSDRNPTREIYEVISDGITIKPSSRPPGSKEPPRTARLGDQKPLPLPPKPSVTAATAPKSHHQMPTNNDMGGGKENVAQSTVDLRERIARGQGNYHLVGAPEGTISPTSSLSSIPSLSSVSLLAATSTTVKKVNRGDVEVLQYNNTDTVKGQNRDANQTAAKARTTTEDERQFQRGQRLGLMGLNISGQRNTSEQVQIRRARDKRSQNPILMQLTVPEHEQQGRKQLGPEYNGEGVVVNSYFKKSERTPSTPSNFAWSRYATAATRTTSPTTQKTSNITRKLHKMRMDDINESSHGSSTTIKSISLIPLKDNTASAGASRRFAATSSANNSPASSATALASDQQVAVSNQPAGEPEPYTPVRKPTYGTYLTVPGPQHDLRRASYGRRALPGSPEGSGAADPSDQQPRTFFKSRSAVSDTRADTEASSNTPRLFRKYKLSEEEGGYRKRGKLKGYWLF